MRKAGENPQKVIIQMPWIKQIGTTDAMVREIEAATENSEFTCCALLLAYITAVPDCMCGEKKIYDRISKLFALDNIELKVLGAYENAVVAVIRSNSDEARVRNAMLASLRNINEELAEQKKNEKLGISCGGAFFEPLDYEPYVLIAKAKTALMKNASDDISFVIYENEAEKKEDYNVNHQASTLLRPEWFSEDEIKRIFKVFSKVAPLMISVNLTQNTYYIIEYNKYNTKRPLETGVFDELIDVGISLSHPDDADSFANAFRRENLLRAYENGERTINYEGRRLGDDGKYHWMRTRVLMQRNADGDICETTIERSIDFEKESELEHFRIQKIMGVAIETTFEYICTISSETKKYEMYSIHGVSGHGFFSEIVEKIAGQFEVYEQREKFEKKMSFSKITVALHTRGRYCIRYNLPDGEREATFYYSDPSCNEILMTVRQIRKNIMENFMGGFSVLRLDTNKDFTFESVNEGFCAMLDISVDEFMEKYRYDVFAGHYPQDRIKTEKLFYDNAVDGAEFSECAQISVDGVNYYWISSEVTVKKDGDDYIYYISCRDCSYEQNLESEVRNLKAAVKHSKIHTWEYDIVGNRAQLGLQTRRYYNAGKTSENFPEYFINCGYVYPADADKYRETCRKLREGSAYAEMDVRTREANTGIYKWRRVCFTTIFDDNGKPVKALGSSEDIDTIRELEQRFHAALELCGFATWSFNIDKNCIVNSSQLEELFGIDEKIMSDVPSGIVRAGIVHPDDVKIHEQLYRELEYGKMQTSCELRLRNINWKKYSWYRIHYIVITDEDGKRLYAIGCAININEQKEAQNHFKAETKQLFEIRDDKLLGKCLANISNDSLSNYTVYGDLIADTSCTKYSCAIEQLANLCEDEETKMLISARLSAEALLQRYNSGEVNYTVEYRRRMKNDIYMWIRTKVNIFENPENGDIMGFMYSFDIDTEKLSQIAMQTIVDRNNDFVGIADRITGHYRILVNSGISGVASTGTDYNAVVRRCADKYRSRLGNEYDYRVVHDEICFDNVDNSIGEDGMVDYNVQLYNENMTQINTYRIVLTYIDSQRTKMMFCRSNITNIVVGEQQRQNKLRRALTDAKNANNAKSVFLASVGHELKMPLSAIIETTKLAMCETNFEEIRSLQRRIETSGKFLLELVNDILDMNRIESGDIELHPQTYTTEEFGQYLDSVIVPLCRKKNITFSSSLACPHAVIVDKLRINQLFFNLLSNAVKFTNDGGRVHFAVLNQQISDGVIGADYIISDTGVGMSSEFMEKMFEPFEMESTAGHGTGAGLGLAVVFNLVKLFGGTINAESTPGVGTTFTLHLDLQLAEDVKDKEREHKKLRFSQQILVGKRVLICDSNAISAQIVSLLLAKRGMETEIAADGSQAVRMFENSENGYYDALLVDIKLPEKDGFEVSGEIRSLLREDAKTVPVVAVCANSFDDMESRMKNVGINDFVMKPVEAEAVYRTFTKYIYENTR